MKKFLTLSMALLMVLTLLAGCSGDSGSSASDGSSSSSSSSSSANSGSSSGDGSSNNTEDIAPVPLTMFRMAMDWDPKTDPILQEFQAKTNTILTFVTAGWDDYIQKMNLMMASGDKVDIMLAEQDGTPWKQWASEGLLLELDPYLASGNYPFIQSVCEADSFASFKVNGKSYVLPGVHHGYDWSNYVRQDWLDNLGLTVPTTLDEYYDMLWAFTYGDPDQNGVDDTYGIGAYGLFGGFTPVYAAFGAKKGPATENLGIDVNSGGSVYSNLFTENGKAAIKYINMLIRDGLVNPDFAVASNEAVDQWIMSGRAGVIFSTPAEMIPEVLANIPGGTAKFTTMGPVTTNGYDLGLNNGPESWLLYGVTSQCENPEKALEFIEFVNSKEGCDLLIAGVKGRHYTEISEDGIFDRITENWDEDYPGGNYSTPYWFGFLSTVYGYIPVRDYPTFEEAQRNQVMYASAADMASGSSMKQAVEAGQKWVSPNINPLTLYKLDENGQLLQSLLREVIEVNYYKMAAATNPNDIDSMWDEFMAEANRVGLQEWLGMYQSGYDSIK